MLKTRAITADDISMVRELHELYYPDLPFPNFLNGFLCGFVIEDEDDGLIMAGGVQPIGEVVLVTDKGKSRIKIGRALIEAQRVSDYVGGKFGLDELVAFIKDNEPYKRHLIKHGFYPRSSAIGMKVSQWAKTTRKNS